MTRIYTSLYSNRGLAQVTGAAILGIAVGKPKFPLPYMVAGNLSLLAPFGIFGKGLSDEEYTRQYREKLDRLGVARIRQELTKYESYDKVVLLCYEDVRKPGEFCHRTLFADWWEEQTGEKVTELEGPAWKPGNGTPDPAPAERNEQTRLF